MAEKDLWHALRDSIGSRWHAVRIEDCLGEGVPDVSWAARGVQGWIELKYLDAWPVWKETLIRIPHFTPAQRLFLKTRGAHAGYTWLLIGVGSGKTREWVLLDHAAAQLVGSLNHFDLLRMASLTWIGEPVASTFLDVLTNPRTT